MFDRSSDSNSKKYVAEISKTDYSGGQQCTGTIIDEKIVMTSKRCCVDDNGDPYSSALIEFGKINSRMNSNPGQFDLFVMARDFSISPEETGVCLLNMKESIIEKGSKSMF